MDSTKAILLLSMIIGMAYCTTYSDGSVHAEFYVKCSDTHLAVYFNKTALDERTVTGYNNRSYAMHFNGTTDAACKVPAGDTSNVDGNFDGSVARDGTFTSDIHIGVAYATNMCGLEIHSDNDYIFYNATVTVTYGENPNSMISREEYDHYNVYCLRNRTVYEKLTGNKFDVESRVTGQETKNTTALFDLSLSHTDMNNQPTSTYKLGDFVRFAMTVNSATDVKGVIQRCWATSDGVNNEYNLINNRCTMEDKTYWQSAPTNKSSIFKTEAFRFLPSGNAIYVECFVRVCLDNDASSECTFCTSGPGLKRKRRDVDDLPEGDSKVVSVKSPIFYIIDKTPTQSSNQGSNGNQEQSLLSGTNGLIIVILVSAFVIVICAAVIKKVFFSAVPVVANAPVVAYTNKGMA